MKKRLFLLGSILLLLVPIFPVYAASLSIGANTKNTTPGGTIRITVNANG